jgi:hypothetical protein
MYWMYKTTISAGLAVAVILQRVSECGLNYSRPAKRLQIKRRMILFRDNKAIDSSSMRGFIAESEPKSLLEWPSAVLMG